MRFVNFYRKPISMFVMVTFTILLCFWANQAPATPAVPASEKNSAASLKNGESENTNFIEQDESEPVVKKGKHFPWLLVGAVVVIGAAALYFLVLKKPIYTLTVILAPGTTGTPAAMAKYKKGEAVSYNYTPLAGYGSLQVKLDDVVVAASGIVTMNSNHALSVSATKKMATFAIRSIPSPVPYSRDYGEWHYWNFRYEITESAGVGAQLVSWYGDMYDASGNHIGHQTFSTADFAAWFTDCGGTGSHIEGGSTRCSDHWYRSYGNEKGWRAEETLEFNDDNGNKVLALAKFTFLAIPGYSSSIREYPAELKILAPRSGSGKVK